MASLVSSCPSFYVHLLQEAVTPSSAGSKCTDTFLVPFLQIEECLAILLTQTLELSLNSFLPLRYMSPHSFSCLWLPFSNNKPRKIRKAEHKHFWATGTSFSVYIQCLIWLHFSVNANWRTRWDTAISWLLPPNTQTIPAPLPKYLYLLSPRSCSSISSWGLLQKTV